MSEEMNAVQQSIGEMRSSIQTRKEENQEIKGRLDNLFDLMSKTQLTQQAQHNELKVELSKIAVNMDNEQLRWSAFEKQQRDHNDVITEIRADVAKLNLSVDALSNSLTNTSKNFDDLDKRICRLERYTYVIYGIILAVTLVASAVGYLINNVANVSDIKAVKHANTVHSVVHEPHAVTPATAAPATSDHN